MTPAEWKEAQLAQPDIWESILGAVARGWCYEENANKTMDSELAVAIAKEVYSIYTAPPQRKPLTVEQKIVLGFLDGSNPLQGVWYGDDHPAFGRAKNWWRRFLRQAFADDFAAHGIKENT